MTTKRLTPRRTTLEKRRAEVMALIVEGVKDAEVARRFSVSREAVSKFHERHAEEIGKAQAIVERRVEDFAISNRVNRVMEYQSLYDATHDWQEEHGLSEVAQRFDAKTGNLIGETVTLNKSVIDAKHLILEAVARELDQLPRGTNGAQQAVIINIIRDEPRLGV